MYYICIADGMADCTPNDQTYHACDNSIELRRIVTMACEAFDDECANDWELYGYPPYRHSFRLPREGENNWSQRVRIAKNMDRVLDIIGMTADEYERENNEL